MFDVDHFISAIEAVAAHGGCQAVREIVARAVADPASVTAALGVPVHAGVTVLHSSKTVTIINMVWAPHMTMMPHNHGMWAVIGVYSGREDNIFWRKSPAGSRWPIEASGAVSLMQGDAGAVGADMIHSVTNPLGRLTAALHVYGGDYLHEAREAWDPETLQPGPFDIGVSRRLFATAERAAAERVAA
jgi:predicted metal-dependent enzyme (double-stranded beta helix superfamily)